jgi:DNA-binding transcriptional regulator YdaS (Cro superfamily)
MARRGRRRSKDNGNPGVITAIDRVGSTRALAGACGVSQPTVIKWTYKNCPPERAIQIESVSGVARDAIRPDIFKK